MSEASALKIFLPAPSDSRGFEENSPKCFFGCRSFSWSGVIRSLAKSKKNGTLNWRVQWVLLGGVGESLSGDPVRASTWSARGGQLKLADIDLQGTCKNFKRGNVSGSGLNEIFGGSCFHDESAGLRAAQLIRITEIMFPGVVNSDQCPTPFSTLLVCLQMMESLSKSELLELQEYASRMNLPEAEAAVIRSLQETVRDKFLLFAVRNNLPQAVKAAVKDGADVNKNLKSICEEYEQEDRQVLRKTSDFSALNFAAENGFAECVQELVKGEADVNKPSCKHWCDRDGKIVRTESQFPLDMAAEKGHLECVQELVKGGADVNKPSSKWDGTNKTREERFPLVVAVENGELECIRELVKAGADVNKPSSKWDGPDFLLSEELFPLEMAVENGNLGCVRELVKAGADVNKPSKCSWAGARFPLNIAAEDGHLECVRELVKAGADVNEVSHSEWDNTCTAVYAAARNGHDHCVAELAKSGADVNFAPQYEGDDDSPVALVAQRRNFSCLEQLIKLGADVSAALLNAAKSKDTEVAQVLLAEVNAKKPLHLPDESEERLGALDFLVTLRSDIVMSPSLNDLLVSAVDWRGTHHAFVGWLLKHGADANQKYDGDPVLTCALRELKSYHTGSLDSVKFLLASGANVNQLSHNGKTPLDICADSGGNWCGNKQDSVVQLLLKAGGVFSSSKGKRDLSWDAERVVEDEEKIAREAADISRPENRRLEAQVRRAIRKQLQLAVRTRSNMFHQVANLPLLDVMKEYLMFGVKLEDFKYVK